MAIVQMRLNEGLKQGSDVLHACDNTSSQCAHSMALFSGPAIRIGEDMFEGYLGYI